MAEEVSVPPTGAESHIEVRPSSGSIGGVIIPHQRGEYNPQQQADFILRGSIRNILIFIRALTDGLNTHRSTFFRNAPADFKAALTALNETSFAMQRDFALQYDPTKQRNSRR